MKSIMRVEQLLNKPFSEIDYKDETQIMQLLYCVSGEICLFEVFKEAMKGNKKFKESISDFEKASKFSAQFIEKKESEQGGGKAEFMHVIIGYLIVQGIDANYVLNELELQDLPILVKALDRKRREELEEHRLWTYFQILPHIDTKKGINSPRSMYAFPWENEEIKKEINIELEKSKRVGEQFFNGNLNI